MRNEIIEMKDLSDSREIMAKKSPPAITILIFLISSILVIALIWAYFAKLDTYVKVSGEVRTSENISEITLLNGGKLSEIKFQDGSYVEKGDVLFLLDDEYYVNQKEIIIKQIEEKKVSIENYEKLITSIKNDKNEFSESQDSEFYHQYESYRLELENALKQISSNNEKITASQNEILQAISQNQASMDKVKKTYEDYSELYNAINEDYQYTGTNQITINIYNMYTASINKVTVLYEESVSAYDELVQKKQENPDSVTQEEIEQAEQSKNAAYADIQSTKASTLNEINSVLQELDNQIDTYQANIDSYSIKNDSLLFDDTEQITIDRIKNSYYININNSIQALETEIDSFESKSAEIEETLSNCNIKAEQDGFLTYSKELSTGDTISAGTTIGTIVPNTSEYVVNLYIPEYEIVNIEIDQVVEYSFSGISSTDFGKTYGKILSVSADSFVNQTNGQKYYKATASIEETQLENSDGNIVNIKVGMIAEIRAIVGTQSVVSWLLDKLNFV